MQDKKQIPGREISRLSNLIRREQENYSTKGEYSGAQSRTLYFLLTHSDQDIFQRDLEEAYGLRPATASQLLKKMEQNGLIIRESSNCDARRKKLSITQKALDYQNKMIHDLEELEEKMIHGINKNDLDVFFLVINQMIQNLS